MTSEMKEEQTGSLRCAAECVTDVLIKYEISVIYYSTDARKNEVYLFYMKRRQDFVNGNAICASVL